MDYTLLPERSKDGLRPLLGETVRREARGPSSRSESSGYLTPEEGFALAYNRLCELLFPREETPRPKLRRVL